MSILKSKCHKLLSVHGLILVTFSFHKWESQHPGPSSILGLLGISNLWHHKSRASLRDPFCGHGVMGTPQREVLTTLKTTMVFVVATAMISMHSNFVPLQWTCQHPLPMCTTPRVNMQFGYFIHHFHNDNLH